MHLHQCLRERQPRSGLWGDGLAIGRNALRTGRTGRRRGAFGRRGPARLHEHEPRLAHRVHLHLHGARGLQGHVVAARRANAVCDANRRWRRTAMAWQGSAASHDMRPRPLRVAILLGDHTIEMLCVLGPLGASLGLRQSHGHFAQQLVSHCQLSRRDNHVVSPILQLRHAASTAHCRRQGTADRGAVTLGFLDGSRERQVTMRADRTGAVQRRPSQLVQLV